MMDDSLLSYKIIKNRTGAEISASGNPAIMPDTLKNNPMNEMKVYGWSKQETTTGAQLFPTITPSTEVKSGITVEYMEHGKIHISGTSEKTVDFMTPTFELLAGTYTLSMGVNIDNTLMRCTLSTTEGLPYFDILNNEASKTETTEDNMILYLLLRVYGGKTIDITIQPMLNTGTSPLPWEPYTGGQPSPSPDYPQEIVSAGMKWSTGINLFDISQAEIGKSTSWGATAGTEIMVHNSKIECLTIIDALPSTTYTVKNFTPGKIWLSRIVEANEEGLGYVNHKHYNNLEQALIQKTITTSANTTKLYISMKTIDGANISADTLKDVQIMIVQGDAIGDYEPYDGGVPKRYGDKINIGVDVDIFDRSKEEKGYVTSRGEISVQSGYKEYYIPMQSIMSGQQNLSVKMIGASKPWVGVGFYGEDKKFLSRTTGYPEVAYDIKIPVKAKYMILSYTTLDVESIEIKYSSFQQSLSIQTPTGLPAIPVNTDGNYTDTNGQQWIADYIDFKRGKYVQNIRILELTGQEPYIVAATSYFSGSSANMYIIASDMLKDGVVMCNCLSEKPYVWSIKSAVGCTTNIQQIHLRLPKATIGVNDDAGLEEVKTAYKNYIKRCYEEGKPIEINYILAEPIERDLTPSEIQAYQNLVTYAGTTIVENDADCYMEVSAGGEDALRAKKLALILGD